jgi:hypothetical protein
VEDSVSQESGAAISQDHRRQAADGGEEQIRLVAEQNGRIKALENELAAIREELEKERQRRMILESQIQVRRSEKQSRMIQTECADEITSGQLGGIGGGKELAEKHNKRGNEKESRWNELRGDIKKMQEVLVEVRGRVEKTSIEAGSKSTGRNRCQAFWHDSYKVDVSVVGVETAIEELRSENAQQRELLKSLTECTYYFQEWWVASFLISTAVWRTDFSRWQNESISSQEKTTLEIQAVRTHYLSIGSSTSLTPCSILTVSARRWPAKFSC